MLLPLLAQSTLMSLNGFSKLNTEYQTKEINVYARARARIRSKLMKTTECASDAHHKHMLKPVFANAEF